MDELVLVRRYALESGKLSLLIFCVLGCPVFTNLRESEGQDRLLDAVCGAKEVLEDRKPDKSAQQR
jgi:hypothetical protein